MDGSFATEIDYIHGSKPFDCNQKEFCQLLSDIKNVKYHFEAAKGKSGRRNSSCGSQEFSWDGSDDD